MLLEDDLKLVDGSKSKQQQGQNKQQNNQMALLKQKADYKYYNAEDTQAVVELQQSALKKQREDAFNKRYAEYKEKKKKEEDEKILFDYFINTNRARVFKKNYKNSKGASISDKDMLEFEKTNYQSEEAKRFQMEYAKFSSLPISNTEMSEYAKWKYGSEEAERVRGERLGDIKSRYYKNYSTTPFMSKIKTMFDSGQTEEEIKDYGYLKKRNINKKDELIKLRTRLRETGDDKIFVPYSVLYTNAINGDIDFAKINELQREDRRINKGQSARKGVYLNVDQLTYEISKTQMEVVEATPQFKENVKKYYESQQRINDLNSQMNGVKSGISTIAGGFAGSFSDSYKLKNMAMATGASVITGGVASGLGATPFVAGAMDLGVDIALGLGQDINSDAHMIRTLENRDMTKDEYIDSAVQSIFSNLAMRYGMQGLGMATKWTLKNGYRLTTKAYGKFDANLLPKIKERFQANLSDSSLLKSGDVSYSYDPVTGEANRVFIDKQTLNAAVETVMDLKDDINNSVNFKYVQDPLSYSRRLDDIKAAKLNDTTVKTYSKVEIENAADGLGKEFDADVKNQKIKQSYDTEAGKHRKQKTQLKIIKNEIEQVTKDINNPRVVERLETVYDKLSDGEISYKEAFDEIYEIRKNNYIEKGIDGFIEEQRLQGKVDDVINNLPEQNRKVKREIAKRQKYKGSAEKIGFNDMTDGEKASLKTVWDYSTLKQEVMENIKDLDPEVQNKILKEVEDRFYDEVIAKKNLTKEVIIEVSNGDVYQSFVKIDEELEQQKVFREKIDEEFNRAKKEVNEKVKNAAGEDVEPDLDDVKAEETKTDTDNSNPKDKPKDDSQHHRQQDSRRAEGGARDNYNEKAQADEAKAKAEEEARNQKQDTDTDTENNSKADTNTKEETKTEQDTDTKTDTDEEAKTNANDETTNKTEDSQEQPNASTEHKAPETVEELATEYVNKHQWNRRKNVDANNEAAKVVKQGKIEIFEAIDGDKNKAVSMLYEDIDKLNDGDYIEYISKEDNYVTGAVQLGGSDRYVYQYYIDDTTSELLGLKLHNINEISSVGNSKIILLPNKKGETPIRLQGEAARSVISAKNNRKLMSLYIDNVIRNEIQKEISIRATADKLGVKSDSLSTNANRFLGFHTSLNVVQRIESVKNRIISALNDKVKLISDGEMDIYNLLRGDFNAEDFLGLLKNKDMMELLTFLSKNGKDFAEDSFTGLSLNEVYQKMQDSKFFQNGQFVGISITNKLTGEQFRFSTPQEVALFYMMNEHSVNQISTELSFTPVEQEYMKYLYENTPQEELNRVFIDGLDDDLKSIFKSYDPNNPQLISTANMIQDIKDYIANFSELDVEKLDMINKKHPLFRVFSATNETVENIKAAYGKEHIDLSGDIGVATQRINVAENVNIMQYIGNSLFRDGYNTAGVLNQIVPIMEVLYQKFDEMQEVGFNRDMYVQKGVVIANKVKNKKGGHAYKLTATEAAEILTYANNIDNNIRNTWTQNVETKKYTVHQAQRMVEKDMSDVMNHKYKQDPFTNIHQKGKAAGKVKNFETLVKSEWFKKFDNQFKWLHKGKKTILREWDEFLSTGKPSDILLKRLDEIKNFKLEPEEVIDDYFDDIMTTRTRTTKTDVRNHTDLTIEEVVKQHLETGKVTKELKMLIDQIASKERIKVTPDEIGERIKVMKESSKDLLNKYDNGLEIKTKDIENYENIVEFLTPLQQKEFNKWLKKPNKVRLSEELINKIRNLSTEKTTSYSTHDELMDVFDKKINSLNKNLYNASQGKMKFQNGMNIIKKIKEAAELNYIQIPDNIKALLKQYENINEVVVSYKGAKSLYRPDSGEELHFVKGGRLTPQEILAANEILKGINKKHLLEGLIKLLSADYGRLVDDSTKAYTRSQVFIGRMRASGAENVKSGNLLSDLILNNKEYGQTNRNLFYLHVDPSKLTPEVKAKLDAKWENFVENVYKKFVDDFPKIQDTDGNLRVPTEQEFYAQLLQLMDDIDNSTSKVFASDKANISSSYLHMGKLATKFESFDQYAHLMLSLSEDLEALDIQGQWVKSFDNNLSLIAEREALGGVTLRDFIHNLRDMTDPANPYITLQTIREAHKQGLSVPKVQNEMEARVKHDEIAVEMVDETIKAIDNEYYKQTRNRLPDKVLHQLKENGYQYFKDKDNLFWVWDKDKGKAVAGDFMGNEITIVRELEKHMHNNMPTEFKLQIDDVAKKGKFETINKFYDDLSIGISQKYTGLFDTDLNLRTNYWDNSLTNTKNIADNLEYYKEHSSLTYGDNFGRTQSSILNAVVGLGKNAVLQTVGAWEALVYDYAQFVKGNVVERNAVEFFKATGRLPMRAVLATGLLTGAVLDTGIGLMKIGGMTVNGFLEYATKKLFDSATGYRIGLLDRFEQMPHINEMALQLYIKNKGINIQQGIQGQLLNRFLSVARKSDNQFLRTLNRLNLVTDSFQGGLELYKQVWSLDYFEKLVGLDWDNIGKPMRAKLNAFGLDNKSIDLINDVLERVNVTEKGIPKAGAFFELTNKSDIDLLHMGLTNQEIKAVRNFDNALQTAAYKRSHDNNRMLFNSIKGNSNWADKFAANTKLGFTTTPLNVLADGFENAATFIDDNGMTFTSSTFMKDKGFGRWLSDVGKKAFYTTAVAITGGVAIHYMSPIVNLIRARTDQEKRAKALSEFNSNYLYSPLNNWANIFLNGFTSVVGGLDFQAMRSSVEMVTKRFIPIGKILYPIIAGKGRSWDIKNFEDNDGEPSAVAKMLGLDEQTYNYILNSGTAKQALLVTGTIVGVLNESTANWVRSYLYENAYDDVTKAEKIRESMTSVAKNSITDLQFKNEIDEVSLYDDIDRMTGSGFKTEVKPLDVIEEAMYGVSRLPMLRKLPAYIRERNESIKNGDGVSVSGNVSVEEQERLDVQAKYKYDDVVDSRWFLEFVDNLGIPKWIKSNETFLDFDDNLSLNRHSPQDIEEANFDYKRTIASFALEKYKFDHDGDLSGLTEESLKKYYDEAEKQYKGGIIKAAQGQMVAMYYEDQIDMIDGYKDNYLMGLVSKTQLEKSFEEIFPSKDIQDRMNDMFTLEEQAWLKKNVLDVMGGNKKINKAKLVVMSELVTSQDEDITLEDIQGYMGIRPEMVDREIYQDGIESVKAMMKEDYGIAMDDEQIKFMAYTGLSPEELSNARNQMAEVLNNKDEIENGKPRTVFEFRSKKEDDRNKFIGILKNIQANPTNLVGIISGNTNNGEFQQTTLKDRVKEYTGVKETKSKDTVVEKPKAINNTTPTNNSVQPTEYVEEAPVYDNSNTPKKSPYEQASEYTQTEFHQAVDRVKTFCPSSKEKDHNMRTLVKIAAPYAQKYNVPIELIMSAFVMETSYGTKVKGKNNVFNVTVDPNKWTGSYTTTYNKENGKTYHWKDFNSLEEAVEDYCKWWDRGQINTKNFTGYRRNLDGTVNLNALRAFAEEGHYYNTMLQQMKVMRDRLGDEIPAIMGQTELVSNSYPLDNLQLQSYAGSNVGTSPSETLELDETLQLMGVQPNDTNIDEILDQKGIHPLAKAMMYEYRDFNPKNNSDRVYQYNVQGANMPEIDSVRELGWDASLIGFIGGDYITSKSISAEQLYLNNGVEVKSSEPLKSGDLVFLDNKNGDIFHVNVVIAALNNGTVLTIGGNENEDGMGIKAYNRSDIKKAKRLPLKSDGTVSGARTEKTKVD